MSKRMYGALWLLLALPLVGWAQGLVQIDHTEEPPNAHIRPSSLQFYEIFVCRAESPTQWVGVSNYFTRHDPWIVAVLRVQEQHRNLPEWAFVELESPKGVTVANDRIRCIRNADHGLFYRTDRLLTKGGYGEWKALLSVDGVLRERFSFTLAPEPWQPPQEVDPEDDRPQSPPPFVTNLPIRRKQSVVDDKISDLLHSLKRYW